MSVRSDSHGIRLTSRTGMSLEMSTNGSLRRFSCSGILVNLYVGNEVEGSPTNLYLRRRSGTVEWISLLGPLSGTRFQVDEASGRVIGSGSWRGIDYSIELVPAQSATAWFWHVRLTNTTPSTQDVDLTYTQDLALAPYGGVRLNEYYISQYVDHTPLSHPHHGRILPRTAVIPGA
jgi:1,2-beta-oligoglucan phosphorylase